MALIRIEGAIIESRDIVKQLETYQKDDGVKAVVLRVNSPGGTVAASQEIHSAVERLRSESGKPVVVSFSNVGASGAYYVACGADWIVANPGTVTGSIGTILQGYNAEQLMDKLGLDAFVVRSGKYKDIGSPFREMTLEEQTVLQELIDVTYRQFLMVVYESRSDAVAEKLKIEKTEESDTMAVLAHVRKMADGRVFSGEQGYEKGFVDELGDLHTAVMRAADMAGIAGEPKVVEKNKEEINLGSLFGFSLADDVSALSAAAEQHRPGLYYMMAWGRS